MLLVERALAERRLHDQHRALTRVAVERNGFASMVGQSAVLRQLFDLIERVAQVSAPVLIRGGERHRKELVARALHFQGARRERAFVAVNCTALPEALLESELFATRAAPSPGRPPPGAGCSSRPTAAPLPRRDRRHAAGCRPSSCGARGRGGAPVALTSAQRPTSASSRRATGRSRSPGAASARTSSSGSTSCRSWCHAARPCRGIPALIEHFIRKVHGRNPAAGERRFAPDVCAALARRPWPARARARERGDPLVVVCTKEVIEMADLELHVPQLLTPRRPSSTPSSGSPPCASWRTTTSTG